MTRYMVIISNFPVRIWILLKIWVQTQFRSSQLENIFPPSSGALITILGIAHAAGGIRHPYVDIQNLLKKLALVQVEPLQLDEVKFHTNKHHCF